MKKKKSGFIFKIMLTLSIIAAIITSGYFFLDKKIVPKYFGQYGIYSIPDLVGVVSSLYNSPDEAELVKNGHTQTDFTNAVVKLQKAGYQINDDGTMKENVFDEFRGDGKVELTDRELAAICNKFIADGILIDALPELNYLNVINISVLELNINPDEESLENGYYTKANISAIMKINTVDICKQIAKEMDTPVFLLNMIIPDNLYFSISYDIDLTEEELEEPVEGEESKKKKYEVNGHIKINGRSEKQSRILIELLIDFIFPDKEKMDIDKFTHELGDVIVSGIDILGDFKFADNLGTSNKQFGVVVNPLGEVIEQLPEVPEVEEPAA